MNATQGNKDGPDWKDPGRWHSHLVSIKVNNKQSHFWGQLDPKFLFVLERICLLEGIACIQERFQSENTDATIWVTKKCLSHWDVLEESSHTAPSPLPILSLYFPLSLLFTHRSSTVRLCNGFYWYAVQGPLWVSSLGSQTKHWRWCYLNAARRLSACIGPGWPSGRFVDACPCQALIAFPLWTSAVCGKAVGIVCGCILIRHLLSSSHACMAEQTTGSAHHLY